MKNTYEDTTRLTFRRPSRFGLALAFGLLTAVGLGRLALAEPPHLPHPIHVPAHLPAPPLPEPPAPPVEDDLTPMPLPEHVNVPPAPEPPAPPTESTSSAALSLSATDGGAA